MERPQRYDISHKSLFRCGSAIPGFRSDDCALSPRAVAAAECGAVNRKTVGRSVAYAGDWHLRLTVYSPSVVHVVYSIEREPKRHEDFLVVKNQWPPAPRICGTRRRHSTDSGSTRQAALRRRGGHLQLRKGDIRDDSDAP